MSSTSSGALTTSTPLGTTGALPPQPDPDPALPPALRLDGGADQLDAARVNFHKAAAPLEGDLGACLQYQACRLP